MKPEQKLTLTIWMNMPSFYQSDLFRALSKREEVDLEVVFARGLPQWRADLGWQPDVEGYRSTRLRGGLMRFVDAIAGAIKHRRRIHIVNGVWGEAAFAVALVVLVLIGSRYIVYSEAPDPRERRSVLKLVFRQIVARLMLHRSLGVLGVSELACQFYLPFVRDPRSIYPFGYFRFVVCSQVNGRSNCEGDEASIFFIGQLVERKGVDLLLRAVSSLIHEGRKIILYIVGEGESRDQLRQMARELRISDRVRFEGVLPAAQIPQRLSQADLLVLPSRWDGWGLVVNEALSVGVPAIVSNTCGVADLIQDGKNGYRFESGNYDDLRSKLIAFLDKRQRNASFREHAFATAAVITPSYAAKYLVDCVRHMTGQRPQRPIVPWHESV